MKINAELSTFLLCTGNNYIIPNTSQLTSTTHHKNIYETAWPPEIADGWWSWCYCFVSWSHLLSHNTDLPSIVNRYTATSQFGAACTNSTMWEYLSVPQFCWLKFHCLVPLPTASHTTVLLATVPLPIVPLVTVCLLAAPPAQWQFPSLQLNHYSSCPSDTVLTLQFH